MIKMTPAAMTTVVLAMIAAGCSSQFPDLVGAGQVRLEKVSAPGVHVMWAEVRQEGKHAVIRGSLVPRGAGTWRRVGHVDVQLTDAQGQPVAHACSEPIYVTLRGPGHGSKLKRFEVRTPASIPTNSKALVTFYYLHDSSAAARCSLPARAIQ